MSANNKKTAFILMEYNEDLDFVYNHFIKKILEEMDFYVDRADEIKNERAILNDIVVKIYDSDLIVADLTNNNPSVFYELGIAHTFNKDTILLTQNLEELPFDLQPYRVIEYTTHFIKVEASMNKFREFVKGSKEGTTIFSNPVNDFIYKKEKKPKKIFIEQKKEEVKKTDERGFLDHSQEWNDGIIKITDIIMKISESTADIEKETTNTTEKIKLIASSNISNSAKIISAKNKLIEFSKFLISYKNILNENNKLYSEINDNIENSLEFILNFQITEESNKIDIEKTKENLEILLKMETSTKEAIKSMEYMRNSIANLPSMEKNLNNAIFETTSELDVLITNMNRTLSQVERSRLILQSKIENLKEKEVSKE